jgi:endonuclease/exonuclease/phosphatase family metal-dependent hydrolase
LGAFYVATTHIGLGTEAEEVAELTKFVTKLNPFIITGDFNSTPESSAMSGMYTKTDLKDTWKELGVGNGYTFDSNKPSKRIDYVFYRGFNLASVNVIDTKPTPASDHRPVHTLFN